MARLVQSSPAAEQRLLATRGAMVADRVARRQLSCGRNKFGILRRLGSVYFRLRQPGRLDGSLGAGTAARRSTCRDVRVRFVQAPAYRFGDTDANNGPEWCRRFAIGFAIINTQTLLN